MCRLYLISVNPPSNNILVTTHNGCKCKHTSDFLKKKKKCQNLFDSYNSLFRHHYEGSDRRHERRKTNKTNKKKSRAHHSVFSSRPSLIPAVWDERRVTKKRFSVSVTLNWQALRTKTHKHIHTQGVRGTHEAQGRLNYLDNKCSKSCCVSVWVCVPVGMLWGQNSLCCEVQLCELCKQLEKDKLTCTAVHTHTCIPWCHGLLSKTDTFTQRRKQSQTELSCSLQHIGWYIQPFISL